MRSDLDGFARDLLAAFEPPPDLAPSAWAEAERVLASGFAAEPGHYRLDRTPWCKEPMDCLVDPTVEIVAITGAAQTGKSTIAENAVGYTAAILPAPALYLVPTDALADTFAARFDAMIAATPALKSKFDTPRRTGATNNKSTKRFEGGSLSIASANSPSALSARPVKVLICDELDRFAVLRREGDAFTLAQNRQATFWNRKAYAISTPTVKDASRIEALYADGDQCIWLSKCPHCDGEHRLSWDAVEWEPGKPETAAYHSPCCGSVLNDAERWRAAQRGRWVATASGKQGIRSFRFDGLMSPWVTLAKMAAQFEAARGKPALLQPFWNTTIGVPYDQEAGDGLDASAVMALAEDYAGDRCPPDAALITAGIDVQGGWLMVGIIAWGDADQGWALQLHEVPGDVKDPQTWAKVEALLTQEFRHPSGAMIGITAVACDSGYETQHILEWSQRHRAKGRRWYATKGVDGFDRPIWLRGGDVSRSLARHFIVGVDQAKLQIMGGLAMQDPGPAKIHMRQGFAEHHFAWAVSEEIVTQPTTGKREWRMKRGHRRNETLDVLALALAVKHSAEFNIPALLERLASSGSIRPPTANLADLAKRMAAASA